MSERIGTYEILRPLARGGMSVVFLVRQPALDREAVLKRLNLESDDPSLAQRFVGEARLAAGLSHPNIVTLFDFFEHENVPYMAMEYVDGGSLRPLVGTLGLSQVIGVLENVLSGLGHAESRGVVHRDLKPENVLISARGTVKIADFGIARAYSALSPRLTSTGSTMGTPTYMAPEQALNRPLGPYTDLYALGVMAYELLAGRPPFGAGAPMAVLYSHVHEPPPPLAKLVPGLPPSMCDWVHRLLAKAPSARPESALEAWGELEEIAVGELGPYWRRGAALAPASAPVAGAARAGQPPPSTPRTRELPTRVTPEPPAGAGRGKRRRLVALGAVAAALAVGAFGALVTSGTSPQPERHAVASRAAHAPRAPRAALPYDFNGDEHQEAVIALPRGARRGGRVHAGVVLVHVRARRHHRPWTVLTEKAAGLPPHARATDAFGAALASADFDRDGRADLVIGAPGRHRVSVVYGAAGGLLEGRRQQLKPARAARAAGAYGYAAVARDLDDDGFADLVVTAPGTAGSRPGSGVLELLFGGRHGLRTAHRRLIRAPAPAADFGRRLRSGDVNGDGHIDLVEGAAARAAGGASPFVPGHLSFCPGSHRGPVRCRAIPGAGGTSSLAVADINGDGYADVVQGDAGGGALTALQEGGGEVRLWLGGRRGPRRAPLRIRQSTQRIPGADEPGDGFGATVEAGDVDADGYADMIVGAPGENHGAGSIAVLRGGRSGLAVAGHAGFGQNSPGVPGVAAPGLAFGSSLALLRLSGRPRPDLVVAAPGAQPEDDRILVISSGRGMFAPGERRITLLGGIARAVRAPAGARIRIGHAERF